MSDNQELDQKTDIPADTFSDPLKSPQKFIPTSFLPENQLPILKYAAWRK